MLSEVKSNFIQIGSLEVSYFHPPIIIAELGINHSGSLDEAKKLADLAAENGADIIKSQFHIPSEEMSNEAKNVVPPHTTKSIYEIIDECSLSPENEYQLKEHIESLNKEYLCTPFSAKAAHILGEMNVSAFKIGSGECSNNAVLEAAAKYQKPLIISTGMNTLESVKKTCSLISTHIKNNFLLMHTTNLYPTPEHLVRLGGIGELQNIVGKSRVGLSDHTQSNLACLGAVACGAVILERHFTDSKEREGPDIINSMTPKELKELKKESLQMFKMRGGSKEKEIKEEDGIRNFAFATIVAIKDIKKGEKFTLENTWPKRPGIGEIPARDHGEILGNISNLDIKKGSHIAKNHFL